MSSKPTIIVVPGSWHVPEHLQLLTDILVSHGYKVVPIRTPSVRRFGPWVSGYSADAAAISSAILTEVELENEVVVVMHSYGGMAGSAAVEGLSKTDLEKKGLKGGVIRLVYMAAFALDAGSSLWGLMSQGNEENIQKLINGEKVEDYWVQVHDKERTFPNDPMDHFYHDVEPEMAKQAISLLQPQSYRVNIEEQKYAAFKYIPSTYIHCTEDRAIPIMFQEMMSSQEGMWTKVRMEGVSHSPFLSKPKETAALIEEAAKTA